MVRSATVLSQPNLKRINEREGTWRHFLLVDTDYTSATHLQLDVFKQED